MRLVGVGEGVGGRLRSYSSRFGFLLGGTNCMHGPVKFTCF